MKKNYIASGWGGFLLIALLTSCAPKDASKGDHHDPGHVDIDTKMKALLKPSNTAVISPLPSIRAVYGPRIYVEEVQGVISYDKRNELTVSSRVSGRVERLAIKYNYQPIHKGQLIMEIYSPDLAAAQQELLYLLNNDGQSPLFRQSRQRLSLLGMSDASIEQVIRSKQINYRIPVYSPTDGFIVENTSTSSPAVSMAAPTISAGGDAMGMSDGMSGGGAPASATSPPPSAPTSNAVMLREGQYVTAGEALFTIYNAQDLIAEFALKPDVASFVKRGAPLVYYPTVGQQPVQRTSIGLIQPVIQDAQNFTIARSYLPQSRLRIGELLTGRIPISLAPTWWIPVASTVKLGGQTVVFRKEQDVYLPQSIKVGKIIGGHVQVLQDIAQWDISSNAAYLIDSESFIKKNESTHE